jgi:hypothetical protein
MQRFRYLFTFILLVTTKAEIRIRAQRSGQFRGVGAYLIFISRTVAVYYRYSAAHYSVLSIARIHKGPQGQGRQDRLIAEFAKVDLLCQIE